ncbi:hypothetical protein BQ6471_00603 [Vibrio gazogenes]|nr:hypothetical protein BQ6471_00603 [Vibrio gazogenes]
MEWIITWRGMWIRVRVYLNHSGWAEDNKVEVKFIR